MTKGTSRKSASAFSAEEKAAMKEAVADCRKKPGADDEAAVLDKIAGMGEDDRAIAERVHALVRAAAPELTCRTWYGMPAYAQDGKVVVFFKEAGKFKERYGTLGFNGPARLDDGTFWPTSYAVTEVTDDVAEQITALVRRAVGAGD